MRRDLRTPRSVHKSPRLVETLRTRSPVKPEIIKVIKTRNTRIIFEIFE